MKFPGVEFLETAPKFRKRKQNSSSCLYVLHKTPHREISRPSRAVTAEKCTKSVMHVRVVVLLFFFFFLTFSLPSPSSLLKLPIPRVLEGVSISRGPSDGIERERINPFGCLGDPEDNVPSLKMFRRMNSCFEGNSVKF